MSQVTSTLKYSMILTYRQTVELIKRLNQGTAGFDYGKYKLADLRNILAQWVAQGYFAADHVEQIAAEVAAAMPVQQAAAGPMPLPAHIAARAPVTQAIVQSMPVPVPPNVATILATPENVPNPTVRQSIIDAQTALLIKQCQSSGIDAQTLANMGVPAHVVAAVVAAAASPQATPAATVPAQPQGDPIAAPPAAESIAIPDDTTDTDDDDDDDDSPAQPATVPAAPANASYPLHVPAAQVWPEYAADVAGLFVTLYGNPNAPKVDPTYIFNPMHLRIVLASSETSPTIRIWGMGPRGTGKTEFARQFAARTGRPLYRVNFNRATEASEIIGDQGLVNGNTLWVDGPVAAACRVQGAMLLLDEITYCNPGNLSALNPILERDGTPIRLPRTSEMLAVPDSLMTFAADNTGGFGDASGEYVSRNVIGADTRNRFNVALQFDYLPKAAESKLLRVLVKRATGKKMLVPVANAIVNVMTIARTKSQNGELSGAPSLRDSSAFATLLSYGIPVADAYNSCVVLNAPAESAEELRQIFAAHWPADLLTVPVASFFA